MGSVRINTLKTEKMNTKFSEITLQDWIFKFIPFLLADTHFKHSVLLSYCNAWLKHGLTGESPFRARLFISTQYT